MSTIISVPKYAAAIAAVITIVVKMIDNKVSGCKGRFIEYFKSSLFNAALVGAFVYFLKIPQLNTNINSNINSNFSQF